jgi:hypothetical protein
MASEGRWTWVSTGQDLADGGFTDWRPGQPDNQNGEQHCMYARIDSPASAGRLPPLCPVSASISSKSNEATSSRAQHRTAHLASNAAPAQDTARLRAAGGGTAGETAAGGSWDDWNCFTARLNFVCEIILQP